MIREDREEKKAEETAVVNENESHHATQEASDNAADQPKIENITGNEYKIEHEIHSLEEESILKEQTKVEEQPPAVIEPEVKVVDHPPHENKDILTSSVKSEWEELKPSSGTAEHQQSVLESSQRSEKSQEPNLLQSHVVVEEKSGSNVSLLTILTSFSLIKWLLYHSTASSLRVGRRKILTICYNK